MQYRFTGNGLEIANIAAPDAVLGLDSHILLDNEIVLNECECCYNVLIRHYYKFICDSEYKHFIACTPDVNCFKVGELEIEDDWFAHINVDARFQRKGIGTMLTRLANQHVSNLKFPCLGVDGVSDYYLTDDGAALVNYCRAAGYIQESQCVHSVP